MSAKNDKKARRIARKTMERSQKRLIMDFLKTVAMFSFKDRLRLAWRIVIKRV